MPGHLIPTAANTVTVDTCVTDHQRAVTSCMIPIIKSGVFNDLTVVCSDGSFSTAVCVLAISFPESMGVALASGEVDVLLLPQHTVAEVSRGVAATCGLPSAPCLVQLLAPIAAATAAPDEHDLGGEVNQEEEEEGAGEDEEVDDEEDDDYEQPELADDEDSETEILGEDDELEVETQRLTKTDTTSCTCCLRCSRARGKTGRPPAAYTTLRSKSGKEKRVAKRLKGKAQPPLTCPVEARDVMARLARKFPELRGNPALHLSWMVLIKTLRLSFKQVRWMMIMMCMMIIWIMWMMKMGMMRMIGMTMIVVLPSCGRW